MQWTVFQETCISLNSPHPSGFQFLSCAWNQCLREGILVFKRFYGKGPIQVRPMKCRRNKSVSYQYSILDRGWSRESGHVWWPLTLSFLALCFHWSYHQPQDPRGCWWECWFLGLFLHRQYPNLGESRVHIFNKPFQSWEAPDPGIKSLNSVIRLRDIIWASTSLFSSIDPLWGKRELNATKAPFVFVFKDFYVFESEK